MASANSIPVRATVRAVRFLNANEPFLLPSTLSLRQLPRKVKRAAQSTKNLHSPRRDIRPKRLEIPHKIVYSNSVQSCPARAAARQNENQKENSLL